MESLKDEVKLLILIVIITYFVAITISFPLQQDDF